MQNKLKEAMASRKITEERLSEITGMTQESINRLKNSGRVPKVDTALRIARALRVPVERIWSLNDKTAA